MIRPMNTTPAIQDLTRRLINGQAACDPVEASARACEMLGKALVKHLGTGGVHCLLSRAVAMARAESPSHDAVRVRADGSLEGLDGAGRAQGVEAGALILSHLLALLILFIGEPLTLRLVRDALPDEYSAGIDAGSGGGS